MLPVKRLAISLWEFVVEELATLLKVAVKSLFYGPLFYGVIWLTSHRAPSHDMWSGFFIGAVVFTVASKKMNRRPNKEPKQPATPIILPPSGIVPR